MTDARVSQVAVEVLQSATSSARLSQVSTEVIRAITSPQARVSQVAIEVISNNTPPTKARLDQVAIEILSTTGPVKVQISQVAIEVIREYLAEYPTYGQHISSTETQTDGLLRDRMVDGRPRGRSMASKVRKNPLAIVHIGLIEAEKNALLAFYATYRVQKFMFTWKGDSIARVCRFTAPPNSEPMGNGYWWVRTFMAEA